MARVVAFEQNRVADCGRKLESPVIRCGTDGAGRPIYQGRPGRRDGYVTLRLGANGAHWYGPRACGCVWTCPVCARKVAQRRRVELREALANHGAAGGVAYMLTLTLPHHPFDKAAELQDCVARGFRSLIGGAPWQRWKARAGVVGIIRKVEVTHGGAGWHPHIHALVLLDRPAPELAAELGAWLLARWCAVVARRLGRAAELAAQDWRRAGTMEDAGEYVGKYDAAAELASAGKPARRGNRSPFQIAADLAVDPCARDAALLREYAAAFHGRRQLTWSRGLRAALLDMPEATDEEVANADDDDAPQVFGFVSLYGFNLLWRRGLLAEALEIAEAASWEAFVIHLAARGIPASCFQPVERAPP